MLGELNIYKKCLDPLKKFCPVLNCMAVIKRVDDHLRKSHHINSSHPDFHKYMNTAQIFDPSSIKIVDRSPCKPWGHDYAIINKQESWSSEEFHNVTANIVDKHTNVQLIKEKKNTLCNESIFINNHNLNQDVIEDASSDFEADFRIISSDNDDLSHESSEDEMYVPIEDDISLSETEFSDLTTNLLSEFLSFLIGPDCRRKVHSSEKCVGDVRRMLILIDGTSNIQKMFLPNVLRDEYVNKISNLDAGSIKKYLFSIISFCDFLIIDEVAKSLIEPISTDVIIRTKTSLVGWRKTFNRQDRKNFWIRQERNENSLVAPNELNSYMQSKSAILASNLFLFFEENDRIVTQAEYVSMRDHLFVIIHFSNAHRSGVTANVTIAEFDRVVVAKDGMYLVSVENHKTFETYGHAHISLKPCEFQWLMIFVRKVRSQIITTHENIFLSWSGLPMDSGAISTQLASLWRKAGLNSRDGLGKRRLCATVVRQTAVTGVRSDGATNLQQVADLMGHSLSTAEKHYHLRAKKEAAGKGSNSIRKVYISVVI